MDVNKIDMNKLGDKFHKDVAEDPFYPVRATEYLSLLPGNMPFCKAKDDIEDFIQQYAGNKICAVEPVKTVTKGMDILHSIFGMSKGVKIENMTVGEVLKLIEDYYYDKLNKKG